MSDSTAEKHRRLFRVNEVAELLGISKASVYRLVDKGALKTVKFSVTGPPITRVTGSSIEALTEPNN